MRSFLIVSIFIGSIFLLMSCQSSKRVAYVHNAGSSVVLSKSTLPTLPELIIKNGDNLKITIFTYESEVSAPFNGQASSESEKAGASALSGYLVDSRGEINFPVLGKLHVAGKTKNQVEEMIKNMISPHYVKEMPVVNVRVTNFKVTVLGDVAGNKIIPVSDDRITIMEALAQAGDLLITGRRDNVLLIRENTVGMRETYRIDLRDEHLIDSPFYYLQQNDLIYIEPNTRKSNLGGMDYTQLYMIVGTLISVSSFAIFLFKQ